MSGGRRTGRSRSIFGDIEYRRGTGTGHDNRNVRVLDHHPRTGVHMSSARTVPRSRLGVRAALALSLLLIAVTGCGQTDTSDPAPVLETVTNSAPVDKCPVFGFDTSAPRLDATIMLETDTVTAGSGIEGTAVFSNDGSESVYFPNEGTVIAALFEPGTKTVVATPVVTYIIAPVYSLEVPAHGTAELPLIGGATPCGPDAPDVLPAGTYDVRFALVTGLSDPVTISVTN
jgi:hypothetical protein